ncbi:MAG TPA: M20/M25/M40 family metallo-hydrolase, partial [Gaiellaceae bacterium]|nr:M20/M25/M40 family metallo-hydrolase [Gaiellaceae bacterium]
ELGYRDVTVDELGNVVGYFGDGPPRLMYNGHLDHVPPAGMDDPYGAQIVDGHLRGRGSLDMKASLAAAAFAAALVDAPLRSSYVFTADVREEVDGPEGIAALLASGLRADFGVSGEATSLDIALGHRGKVQLDVTILGRSSHAASPCDGENAVYAAAPFLAALEREAERLPSDRLLGDASLTVTGISSNPTGDVAVVPSSCTIRIDRRYIRDETPDSCRAAIEDLVARVAAENGARATVELVNVYPLMITEPNSPIVAAATAAVEEATGRRPALKAWRFGVNATWMNAAGIPSVGLGPGEEHLAHTPDERVPIGEVLDVCRAYAQLIGRLCA